MPTPLWLNGFEQNIFTAGTVTASKAVVVDSNKDIATFRHVTLSGNLVSGSTTITETELGYLDGLTTGTVAASKAVVVDANKDIGSLRNVTVTGNIVLSGSLQNTNTTAVTADATPPVLTFTDGLNLVSNTTDANDLVHLPTNVAGDIGKEIEIYAVEGFELRSADAAATLNNVVIGDTNECAFVAGTYAKLKCVADNTWLAVNSTLIDGTQTKLVPDAV